MTAFGDVRRIALALPEAEGRLTWAPALLESLLREAWRRSAPKRLTATLEEPR